MPRKRRRVQRIVLSNQQADGLFGDLARSVGKSIFKEVKKEVKKQLPKLGKQLGKAALSAGRAQARKTKIGRQLGLGHRRRRGRRGRGLKLAGQGPVLGKQRKRRRRKPGVRVIMI